MKRMRMRTDGLLTLVLVTSMLWVSCMCAGDMVALTTIYQGVAAFDFKASCETIKKQPKWGGEGAPPLSLEDAIKMARKATGCIQEKLLTVELSRIINRAHLDDDTNWYYKITFSRAPKFPEDVVILFDGTAIFPQRAKPVNGVGRPDFGEGP